MLLSSSTINVHNTLWKCKGASSTYMHNYLLKYFTTQQITSFPKSWKKQSTITKNFQISSFTNQIVKSTKFSWKLELILLNYFKLSTPLSRYMNFGKLHNFPVPQFPHLQNRWQYLHYMLTWGLNEIMPIKHWEQSLAENKTDDFLFFIVPRNIPF